MRPKFRLRSILAAALVVAGSLSVPNASRAREANEVSEIPALGGGVVLVDDGGRVVCRDASPEETAALKRRDPDETLHVIKGARSNKLAGPGLTIILRSTPQLDGFPAAKAAFVRAAETWEALLSNPVTIVVDVDFGPKRFGETYPQGVLGSTDPQYHPTNPDAISTVSFATVRSKMIAAASDPGEAALLDKLPATSVPTSDGPSSTMAINTAVQRVIGILPAAADPNATYVPSIGFNSGFDFDFDESNGVDGNKFDFNFIVLHELGHVLGFNSWSGLKELDSSYPALLTTWDLFRFRPGVTTDSFSTAPRLLDSGGDHVFYAGLDSIKLSTGRPNGAGGDGRQASHWKDRELNNGVFIGIMDPTADLGELEAITRADLEALDYIGWTLTPPVRVDAVAGLLDGNTLQLSGSATVLAKSLASAEVSLLDAAGGPVAQLPGQGLSLTGSITFDFTLQFAGLDAYPTATQADVVLFDSAGNQSAAFRVNFGAAEAGAPTIASASFEKNLAKLSGSGFTAQTQLEVNGAVVTPPLSAKPNGKGTKLKVKGKASALGLVSGPNRIRVLLGGKRSNIVVLNN